MEFITASFVEDIKKHPLKSEIEEIRDLIGKLHGLEVSASPNEFEKLIEKMVDMLNLVNLRLQNRMPSLYDKSKQAMYFEIMELNRLDFSYRLKYSLELELSFQKIRKHLKDTFEKAFKYVNDEAGEIIKMKISKPKEEEVGNGNKTNGKDSCEDEDKDEKKGETPEGNTMDDLQWQIYMKNMIRNELRNHYGLTSKPTATAMETNGSYNDIKFEMNDEKKLKIQFVKNLITESIEHCAPEFESQIEQFKRSVLFKLNFIRKSWETNKDPFQEILVNWELEAGHSRHNYGM